MKIDFAKTIAPSKNTFGKSSSGADKSSFAAENGENSNSESVESNDFASVLESLGEKEKNAESKNTDSSKKAERDVKTRETQVSHEKNASKSRASDDAVGEDAAAAANARTAVREITSAEVESVPPARQILHIADLERIVSSVRVNQLDGGQNQLVLTLKNSVFNGLQIKLTTDENKRVTAEFVAASEKVKAHIDSRSGELTELLRRRGVQVTSLQTTVDTGTSGKNQDQQRADHLEQLSAAPAAIQSDTEEVEPALEIKETSGHSYRV